MSRFVLLWALAGLFLSLVGRILADFLWIGVIGVYLVWALVGIAFGLTRMFQARDPSRRPRSLRDLGLLTGCGLGVVLAHGPLYGLGNSWLVDFRFESARPTYERIVADLPDHVTDVQRLTGSTGEYFIDPGPPVRVAFVLPPGRFIDNWCGVVYDPTGAVMQSNQFDGNWSDWRHQVPREIIKLFGGDMLSCRQLDSEYYRCCFT
jgi:hypothetical protein